MKSQAQSRTRVRRLIAVLGCVVAVGATAACAAKVDKKAPEPDVTAKELKTERSRHWRGPVSVVIDTVRTQGNLTTDQREQVDTIARELEDDLDGRCELHEKLRNSAVSVVRSGTTNSQEFDESVKEAVQAIEQRVQRGTDAVEEIHAILEPDQRAAVATALRAHIAEKFGKAPDEKRHREGFKNFASDLMLSKLQIEQLATIKKELLDDKQQLRPTREELLALVDAFESDDFATALDEFRAKKSVILRTKVATAGKRADTVLSIFTPEQRELIADLILDGPGKVLVGDENAQTRAP